LQKEGKKIIHKIKASRRMDLKRAHTVYAQNKSAVAIPSGNYYKII